MQKGSYAPDYGFPNLGLIQNSVRLLHKHFGKESLNKFGSDFLLDDESDLGTLDPVIRVQKIARRIARFYGLDAESFLVTFNSGLDHPAHVELKHGREYFIEMQDDFRHSSQLEITAVLAHELAHVYLYASSLRTQSTYENEILTDVTACYLGAGWTALACFEDFERRGRTGVHRTWRQFGYLTPSEMGFVLALRERFVGTRPRRFSRSEQRVAQRLGKAMTDRFTTSPPHREASWVSRLIYLYRKRRASRLIHETHEYESYSFPSAPPGKLVFCCSTCFQKLRVDLEPESVTIRCSVCDSAFECKL